MKYEVQLGSVQARPCSSEHQAVDAKDYHTLFQSLHFDGLNEGCPMFILHRPLGPAHIARAIHGIFPAPQSLMDKQDETPNSLYVCGQSGNPVENLV